MVQAPCAPARPARRCVFETSPAGCPRAGDTGRRRHRPAARRHRALPLRRRRARGPARRAGRRRRDLDCLAGLPLRRRHPGVCRGRGLLPRLTGARGRGGLRRRRRARDARAVDPQPRQRDRERGRADDRRGRARGLHRDGVAAHPRGGRGGSCAGGIHRRFRDDLEPRGGTPLGRADRGHGGARVHAAARRRARGVRRAGRGARGRARRCSSTPTTCSGRRDRRSRSPDRSWGGAARQRRPARAGARGPRRSSTRSARRGPASSSPRTSTSSRSPGSRPGRWTPTAWGPSSSPAPGHRPPGWSTSSSPAPTTRARWSASPRRARTRRRWAAASRPAPPQRAGDGRGRAHRDRRAARRRRGRPSAARGLRPGGEVGRRRARLAGGRPRAPRGVDGRAAPVRAPAEPRRAGDPDDLRRADFSQAGRPAVRRASRTVYWRRRVLKHAGAGSGPWRRRRPTRPRPLRLPPLPPRGRRLRGPGRPAPRDACRTLDRALGPRGRHRLAVHRPQRRAPQPRLLDLRRVPRVLRVGAVERRRPARCRPPASPSPSTSSSGSSPCRASSARSSASPTRSRSRCSAGATGRSSPRSCCSLPAVALAWVVSSPETSFGVLLRVAALAGFGGGNFASSMTNISFFYPEREKGKALGLNAAGGNLGTGIVQIAVPRVIAVGAGVHLERAGLVFIPLALLAALAAWRWMDNLAGDRGRLPVLRRRRRGTRTPGSSRSSTSAPSARSSATPVRSRRC